MDAMTAFSELEYKEYPEYTGIDWLDEALQLALCLLASITKTVDGRVVKCGDLENR